MRKPRIGVGVLIVKDGKILLGKRINAHGAGTWCPPGGHLEFGETPEQCARRETLEETGLPVVQVRRGPYTNDFFAQEGKHYITLFMIASIVEGEPKVLEPDKCEQWSWFDCDQLPDPLFLTLKNLLKKYSLTSFDSSAVLPGSTDHCSFLS